MKRNDKTKRRSEDESTHTLFGLQGEELRLIGMIIAFKALLFLFAGQSYQVLQNQRHIGWRAWFEIWNRWDSINYQKLAEFGYNATDEMRPRLVFYPLYPWIVRLFTLITQDYLISAFVVSTIASLVTAILLYRLVTLEYSRELAQRAVWFMFIFPTSYFLHIGYTESLFLMLAIAAVISARKQRWVLAGILGALTCLTRVNGLVLIPALLVEAGNQYWTSRRWQWQWLAIGLIGLGFGGYLLLNQHVTGDPFAFSAIMRQNFHKSLTWPWTGIDSTLGAMNREAADAEMIGIQELIFIVLGLVCTIVSWVKLRPVYSVWMTVNWLLFTSVTFVLSVPRYTLTMFPIFILFAMLAAQRIWMAAISFWSILYLGLFTSLFVWGRWAF
jgi:Gpi18-like mannosyltransferase